VAALVANFILGAIQVAISGAISTIAGSLDYGKRMFRSLDGAIATLSGALTRGAWATTRALDGAIATITGALSTASALSMALSGDITPMGTIFNVAQRVLYGSVVLAGSVTRHIGKVLSGAISIITGALVSLRIIRKHLNAIGRAIHLTSNRRGVRERDEY
jgi:uncharacterized membrane protein